MAGVKASSLAVVKVDRISPVKVSFIVAMRASAKAVVLEHLMAS